MQEGKEITIRVADIETGIISMNNQTATKEINLGEKQNQNDQQPELLKQIQSVAFKNISQVSVNKNDGAFGVQKKHKTKNLNLWVQKNRAQILAKLNINPKQGNPNQQRSFNQEAHLEDQENQHKVSARNGSVALGGITIDFKRENEAKSPDQSPIMGSQKPDSKNDKIIEGKGFSQLDESLRRDKENQKTHKGVVSKSVDHQAQNKDKAAAKKVVLAEKGYEWDPSIETDSQLLNKLLDEVKYRPTKEWKDQFEKDISEILLGSEVQDKRAVGSLLGITVFGIVGFVASGLNPIGLVAGAVAGGVIGQYAGRKIKKKLLRTKKLLQFDLFTLKLNCYIKFGLELQKSYKLDINTYRFYLEKVIEEMKMAIQYRRFRQKFHKDIKKILDKFVKLMKKDFCYKAIYLSYKLTKEIIKRKKFQENNMPEFTADEEEQIVDCVLNVLIPTLNILLDSPETLTPALKAFQFKLEKLSKDYVILSLIEKGNHVSTLKNKTIKQIEELDQQLDQEINIEAFERIFNPEHIKQFINKEDNMTLSQAQGGPHGDILATPKHQESTNKNKALTASQHRKSHQLKLGQDGEQEMSVFNANNHNHNDLNKIAEEDQRSSGSNQKQEQRQQRIIDLYLQAVEQRNKIQSTQKKEEENDIGVDETGQNQDDFIVENPSLKKKGSSQNPNQYPTFSKQHLSKIAQKESINQSPANPYNNNQDELLDMDRINQKQLSFQIESRQEDQSNLLINPDSTQNRKVSNFQIKFDQVPRKQLDHEQEEVNGVESKSKITNADMRSPTLLNNNKQTLDIAQMKFILKNNEGEASLITTNVMNQQDYSQNDITQNNIQNVTNNPVRRDSFRSFARNDNRTFLKMNSDESIFSKKDQDSPRNPKNLQLVGDVDQPMRDSIVGDNQSEQLPKLQIDTPKRKSNFSIQEIQKRASQLGNSALKQNSQLRQSIVVSRDDNHKEEVVVVNIPEIPKEEKMSQSTSKDKNGDYDPQTQEKFDRLISLVREDPEKTWECVIKKDDCMFIYKKMIPGNPCVLVRAESVIKDCNADEVFVQIYNAEIRSKWDKVTLGFTVIDTISEGVDVIYFYVDPGLGVTKRDFCQTRVLKRDYPEKGQTTIVFYSIPHHSCPERKGFIRAFSHIAGYVIRPQGNNTSLTIMTQSDVKGAVPKYVVNFMAARAPPKWIESMRKGCIDYRGIKNGTSTQKKKK